MNCAQMEAPFSPIIRKIASEIVAKSKRCFTRPSEICLEDWWLSKLDDGKGLAISGRPVENTKCDTAQKKLGSTPARMRFAFREFHSTKVIKRHGCTTLETSDGIIVSLCGFINKSRTQQNGFSSEVCRDFIFGFPYNWNDYATSVNEDLSQSNPKDFNEILPAALDNYNGAQLHDMVLSLTDAERDQFNKKVYDNVIGLLSPQPMDVIEAQPSKSSTQADEGVLNSESQRTEASNKRQTRSQTSSKQESYKKKSRVKKM